MVQVDKKSPNPDNPLDEKASKEEDFLRRRPLAERIADMINELGSNYKDSIVIGIEGEWGSGKTSFINFILDNMRPTEKNNLNNLIVEFNPWNFSNQNELIKDFFGSIAEGLSEIHEEDTNRWTKFKDWVSEPFRRQTERLNQIQEKDTNLRFKFKDWISKPFRRQNIAKMIGGYALKLLEHSEIELAPTVSIAGLLNFRFNAVWNFRRGNEKPLEHQRKEIVRKFGALGKRIIIVIDDIDRLDSDETKLIFKLVKLTTNFPNTVFLLAYDRSKVGKRMDERGMASQDGIRGEEYLKKIIQQPFLIPKPAREDIYGELDCAIDQELKNNGFGKGDVDEPRLRSFTGTLEFREFFKTVRDIRRYINSLRLDLKFLDKIEINPVDFVVIEVIRVFAPGVYLAMTDEKLAFTTSDDKANSQRKEIYEKIRDKIIKKAPEELKNPVEKIIRQLFPQLKGHIGSELHYKNELMVCSADVFDKYFLLSITPSSVSESERYHLLLATSDTISVVEKLGQIQREDKLRSLFYWMPEYLDQLDEPQSENLLIGIFDFLESMNGGGELETYKRFAYQAGGIGHQVLKRIDDGKRGDFLKRILDKTKDISIMILIINLLTEEIKVVQTEEPLLAPEDIEDLKKSYAIRIKRDADAGLLVDRKNWASTLYHWKEWGEEENVKIYIENIVKTDEGVLSLLREFDRMTRVPLARTSREMLGVLIDLDKLDERVGELDMIGLSEEDAKIIELYRNPPKDPKGRS